MKKVKALLMSTLVVAVVGGGTIMASSDQKQQSYKSTDPKPTQQAQVSPEPVTEEATVVEESPVVQAPQQAATEPNAVVDPCVQDKLNALKPTQAKLDEYTRLIQERSATLREKFNATHGEGAAPNGITVDKYIEYDLNQTLRPVMATWQSRHDAVASQYDC